MIKKLIIIMGILGTIFACKCKEKAADQQNNGNVNTVEKKNPAVMPDGRLLRVTYSYQGMMMMEFGNFDLHSTPEGCKLTFRHFSNEVTYEVSDTLLDAARSIIEQEKMYEYDSYYSFKSEHRMLDGYHWDFDAWFEGDKRISSGGSHVSPGGNGLHKIEELLSKAAQQLVKDEKE